MLARLKKILTSDRKAAAVPVPAPAEPEARPLPIVPPAALDGQVHAYSDGVVLRTAQAASPDLAATYADYLAQVQAMLPGVVLQENTVPADMIVSLKPTGPNFLDLFDERPARTSSITGTSHRARALRVLEASLGRRVSDIYIKRDAAFGNSRIDFEIDGSEELYQHLSPDEARHILEGYYAMASEPGGRGHASHNTLDASNFPNFTYMGTDLPPGISAVRGQYISNGKDGDVTLVIRIVTQGRVGSFEEQGEPPEVIGRINRLIRKPHGAIVVVGTMGHGKTTLAYAVQEAIYEYRRTLGLVHSPSGAEDPPERIQEYFFQQIHARTDRDWDDILMAWRRQARKLAYLGEIRNLKQAMTVADASTYGCRVTATMHLNDIYAFFTKLRQLGLPEYLLNEETAWGGIIARRLVPVLCPQCSTPWFSPGADPHPLDRKLKALGLERSLRRRGTVRSDACPPDCYRGQIGRRPLTEVIDVERDILAAFLAGDRSEIRRLWRLQGGTSIIDRAWGMMAAGQLDPRAAEAAIDLERLTLADFADNHQISEAAE